MTQHTSRRQFIQKAGTLACGAAVFTQPALTFAREDAKEGFEKIVAEVGDLERMLGLNDLASFTPKLD